MRQRIEFLDGHRGLAILLELGYHAYTRWPGIVPYGDEYAGFPLFAFGWLGVRLFFLVSGFVILLTLERSRSTQGFLVKRWLRLFPAMLVCSLLVYATAPWLPERPNGIPLPGSLLPGLTFLEPQWWAFAFGVGGEPIEGAFWSLFVEAKFYVFAALCFFAFGRGGLIGALLVAYGAAVAARVGTLLAPGNSAIDTADALFFQLSFQHFGWFAAGCALYVYWDTRKTAWLLLGLGVAVVSAYGTGAQFGGGRLASGTIGVLVTLLFAFSLRSPVLQRLLASRLLLFLGFISYPLYLIHENAMVSMTAMLGRVLPQVPGLLLPIGPVLLLCAVAYAVARLAEPGLRELLVAFGRRFLSSRPRPARS